MLAESGKIEKLERAGEGLGSFQSPPQKQREVIRRADNNSDP
jgi:hypothetical protein